MTTIALEKAREAREAMREAGLEIERLDPLQKAAANPKSRSLAIRAKCYDCVGRNSDPGWTDVND